MNQQLYFKLLSKIKQTLPLTLFYPSHTALPYLHAFLLYVFVQDPLPHSGHGFALESCMVDIPTYMLLPFFVFCPLSPLIFNLHVLIYIKLSCNLIN